MLVKVRETKVNNFDAVVMIQKQILWLQVPVHDTQLVDVFDTRNYLLIHLGRFFFFKAPVLDDVLEQLATRAVFHDEVQVVIVLDHFVQLHNVWVPNLLENGDLTVDPIDIRLILNFVLLKDFNCYLVAGYDMRSLLDLAKRTFTLGFTNNKASDLLALAVLLLLGVFSGVVIF